MERKLVKLSEAYHLFPFTKQTVRIYASKGKIPCYRVGHRFYCYMDEVTEFAKSLTIRMGGNHAERSKSNQQSFK